MGNYRFEQRSRAPLTEKTDPEGPTIAAVPPGWMRTQRSPFVIANIEWRSYKAGIRQNGTPAYVLVAEYAGALATVRRHDTTYIGQVGDEILGHRWRSEFDALEKISMNIRNRMKG